MDFDQKQKKTILIIDQKPTFLQTSELPNAFIINLNNLYNYIIHYPMWQIIISIFQHAAAICFGLFWTKFLIFNQCIFLILPKHCLMLIMS